jgi:MFS family permease
MMGLVSIGARPSTRGSVMGTFQSSASLARVLGPVTAGLLYDVWLGAPFLLASGLMLVALAIAASQSQPSGLRDAEASPR